MINWIPYPNEDTLSYQKLANTKSNTFFFQNNPYFPLLKDIKTFHRYVSKLSIFTIKLWHLKKTTYFFQRCKLKQGRCKLNTRPNTRTQHPQPMTRCIVSYVTAMSGRFPRPHTRTYQYTINKISFLFLLFL